MTDREILMNMRVPTEWPTPVAGWPTWLWAVPYDGGAHPGSLRMPPMKDGANCQRFAYAVLEQFGRTLPPFRSSELWDDATITEAVADAPAPLDLVLVNESPAAWGAHVAILMARDQLLHLSVEVGRPAVWSWADFAARPRYRCIVGAKRVKSPAPDVVAADNTRVIL